MLAMLMHMPAEAGQAAASETYSVSHAGDGLRNVSMRLYGSIRYWKLIAELNQLQPPYAITLGAELRIPFAPTISQAEGERRLLKYTQNRKTTPYQVRMLNEFDTWAKDPTKELKTGQMVGKRKLLILTGGPAEKAYRTLSAAQSRRPASNRSSDKFSRRSGRDLTCGRVPISTDEEELKTGRIVFETRCIGYINESD